MSDESHPPQLRLRPRKRDDEPAPAGAPAAVPPMPLPEPPVETPPPPEAMARFRLKPKLSVDTEIKQPDPILDALVPVPPAVPEPVVANPEDTGLPRLKLKALTPNSSSPVVVPAPPPIPGSALIGALPPLPAVPSLAPASDAAVIPPPPLMVGGLPPVVVKPPAPRASAALPPRGTVLPPVLPPSKAATKSGHKKIGIVTAVLIAIPVVCGVAAYLFLSRGDDPVPVVVTYPTVPPPVTAPAPNAESTNPAPKIAPLPPPPSFSQTSAGSTKTKTGPTSSAVTIAFKAWIDDARITGVVVGNSPRAIINGRLVRPGDVVDGAQGIVFDGLDLERKEVVFRNGTGLFAGKAY